MSAFPERFPLLPSLVQATYTHNTITAHEVISDIYTRAVQVSKQADSDPLRIAFHIDAIISDALPLLSALEQEQSNHHAPLSVEWLQSCATFLAELVNHLREAADLGKGK